MNCLASTLQDRLQGTAESISRMASSRPHQTGTYTFKVNAIDHGGNEHEVDHGQGMILSR